MRILVVEDDPVLADGLSVGLELTGAAVDAVTSCADAEAAWASGAFDVVVLDLMLPDGSGLDVLTRMRRAGDRTPVLLLTALDEIADRIRGLDSGADDYLGKPFDLDELGARVRAIVRRRAGRASPTLQHDAVSLDIAAMTADVDGRPVSLSRREFAILAALMEYPDRIRSKGELEERLYGWQEEIESNTVEVHIHHLRAKIGKERIETVRGIGYRMKGLQP